MTAVELAPTGPSTGISEAYVESVISFNVKVRLTAQHLSQTALGQYLGIKRATMSQKMTGRVSWSATDLVKAARFLGTDVETLLDDSLMKQVENSGKRRPLAAAGPRYIALPQESAPRGTRTHNPRLKRTLL